MLCLLDRGAAKFIQEGTYKYIPIAIYLEEQNFLKSKIMAVLRPILIGIRWNEVYMV
jgi:hypothetical protein